MDNVLGLIENEVNIYDLNNDIKEGIRKFYYEMPKKVRTSVVLQFQEVFSDVTPKMFMHLSPGDVDAIIEKSSELVKIFDMEFKKIKFMMPADWIDRVKSTVYTESWSKETLLQGLLGITRVYTEKLEVASKIPAVLQVMANYLRAWLRQKECGLAFYSKVFYTEEYNRISNGTVSLCEIVDEYLRISRVQPASKIGLEKLFYTILQTEPSEHAEDNIFFILDIMNIKGIRTAIGDQASVIKDCARVSTMTESTVSDNIGQVSIFGTHDFGSMSIDQIKDELLRLNRNTLSEYLNGKIEDTFISFDISDQVKMILREELSSTMCVASVKRGDEVDMVTLLTLEGKTYLLFRKIGNDNVTFGIAIGAMANGERELIGISNESEFTYSLVGGEEIGM